jgi:hypothetical protein
MSVHRFRELFDAPETTPAAFAAVGSNAAFVPCPVMSSMSPMQQSQTEFLYRLAFEQAQAQVAPPRSARWPAFSLN